VQENSDASNALVNRKGPASMAPMLEFQLKYFALVVMSLREGPPEDGMPVMNFLTHMCTVSEAAMLEVTPTFARTAPVI
jgi:hypothetical protein